MARKLCQMKRTGHYERQENVYTVRNKQEKYQLHTKDTP